MRVEQEVLMEQGLKHHNIIHGALSAIITAEKKNEVWRDIAQKVNQTGHNNQSMSQVKKKWTTMRREC